VHAWGLSLNVVKGVFRFGGRFIELINTLPQLCFHKGIPLKNPLISNYKLAKKTSTDVEVLSNCNENPLPYLKVPR